MLKSRKIEKWYIGCDHHFPFNCKTIQALELAFLKRVKPDGIVFLGDMFDMYQISSFDKDPDRELNLQSEIDLAVNYLSVIRRQHPNIPIIFIKGNHEDRLRRYLWSKAPALSCLRSLRFESLLGFKDNGITFCEEFYKKGDLYMMHGDIVRRHAGYSAKAMFEKHGVSLIHGHTHRDGKYTVRNRSGHFAVWENFCQCDLNPEYTIYPNWSQGWSLVTFYGNRPYVEQVPVINGVYIYGGKVFGD